MHINDLGFDILDRVFSILSYCHNGGKHSVVKDHLRLLPVSSVCRAWRAYVWPDIHFAVSICYYNSRVYSNAKDILASGHIEHIRCLKINTCSAIIETVDLVGMLETAGIGRAVWSRIRALEIEYSNHWIEESDRYAIDNYASTARLVADYFAKHLPRLGEITFVHNRKDDSRSNLNWYYPYSLLPELAGRYSTQISSLDLYVPVGCLPEHFTFSKQLTRLTISMDGFEKRMLAAILAPSLQYLCIKNASPDITWNWFCSENDAEEVCFSGLKELWIRFVELGKESVQSYHNGNLANIDRHSFRSSYGDSAKRVYFPVLSKLRVIGYPYNDNVFYQIFTDCTLKDIHIESPRKDRFSIPSKMLVNLTHLSANLGFDDDEQWFEFNGHRMRGNLESDYARFVNGLFCSPSTVHTATIFANTCKPIPLPDEIKWIFVQYLKLDFFVDMDSVYTVLRRMPQLKKAEFQMAESSLQSIGTSGGEGASGMVERKANKSVGCISWFFEHCFDYYKDTIMYCLLDILRLVPSLLKLKINDNLVDMAKEMLSDPTTGLQKMYKQLDIVDSGYCYS